MSAQELGKAVMELPEEAGLELATRIIAGNVAERESAEKIAQAIDGIESVITGKIRGLTEEGR